MLYHIARLYLSIDVLESISYGYAATSLIIARLDIGLITIKCSLHAVPTVDTIKIMSNSFRQAFF